MGYTTLMENELKTVYIFTDGACKGNPGPGGWGAILRYKDVDKEIWGGESSTTNNRMEMLALIRALELLKESCYVVVTSDSRYLLDGLQKGWAKRWRSNNWMRNKKEKALNPDLWDRLLNLTDRHRMEYRWIRGHQGHPENERCDALAVAGAEYYARGMT